MRLWKKLPLVIPVVVAVGIYFIPNPTTPEGQGAKIALMFLAIGVFIFNLNAEALKKLPKDHNPNEEPEEDERHERDGEEGR